MIGYARKFEGNTTISFKINDSKLLKKYNQIWKRAEKLLKIEYDSKHVYGENDKYIKTKIKIYDGRVNTNFQDKKIRREKTPYKFLSIIMLDSVIKAKKKHYPQTLLEECKYDPKKIKTENLIDEDLKRVYLMSQIMILMMRQNLIMKKIMMNPMNNLLKAKKVF